MVRAKNAMKTTAMNSLAVLDGIEMSIFICQVDEERERITQGSTQDTAIEVREFGNRGKSGNQKQGGASLLQSPTQFTHCAVLCSEPQISSYLLMYSRGSGAGLS